MDASSFTRIFKKISLSKNDLFEMKKKEDSGLQKMSGRRKEKSVVSEDIQRYLVLSHNVLSNMVICPLTYNDPNNSKKRKIRDVRQQEAKREKTYKEHENEIYMMYGACNKGDKNSNYYDWPSFFDDSSIWEKKSKEEEKKERTFQRTALWILA